MTVTFDTEVPVRGETGWYWRIVQPVDSPDVDIDLGPVFEAWDDEEIQLVLRAIARKLQYTASMLLSHPLVSGDEG